MRTLSRPMFNMGGPIKQGIMNGIREPHKHGGPTGTGLVGDQRYPKTDGREHHYFFLPALGTAAMAALRAAPMVYRGLKAGRAFAPGNLGAWGRIKSMLGPTTRFRQPPTPKGYNPYGKIRKGGASDYKVAPLSWKEAIRSPETWGKAIRENPITSLTALTLPATAADLTRKHGADVAKGGWNLAKKYAAAVVPGDQSHWWKEPVTHDTVPGVPGGGDPGMYYDKTRKIKKELSDTERKAFANKQRNERVQKYLDMMGYDRSKKTAIADALIDASKIVSDRGSLDPKNITQELINPVIQATSKRLDKPDQIREAVGLMATKAEIEKDLNAETDALAKKLTLTKIKQGERALEEGFETDIRNLLLTARTPPNKTQLEQYARLTANKYGEEFTKVTDEQQKAATGATEDEKIQSLVTGDGIYMIGSALVRVTGGVPKHIV